MTAPTARLDQPKSRLYWGWNVVAVSALAIGFSGSPSYAFGFFLKPVAEEFGASRAAASLGMTLWLAATALYSPLVGRLLDRGSIRRAMVLGVLMLAGGFASVSAGAALWQLAAGLTTLVALGSVLTGPIPASKLATSWFDRLRGRALGITAIGSSLGGLLLPPLASLMIEHFGWRVALRLLGAGAALLLLPAIGAVIHNGPAERGLLPDGGTPRDPAETAPPAVRHPEWTTRSTLRARNFWALVAALGLMMGTTSGIMTHLVPYALDRGVSGTSAAFFMSCLAACGIAGKLAFGIVADHVDQRIALLAAIGLALTSTGLLLGHPGHGHFLVASMALGLATGAMLPVWSGFIVSEFGAPSLGRVMGLSFLMMQPLLLGGAPLAGWIFDRTHDYTAALETFLGALGAAACAVLLLRPFRDTPVDA